MVSYTYQIDGLLDKIVEKNQQIALRDEQIEALQLEAEAWRQKYKATLS